MAGPKFGKPGWVIKMINDVAFEDTLPRVLAEKYEKSESTVYNWLYKEEIIEAIKQRKEELDQAMLEELRTAARLAARTYLEGLRDLPMGKQKIQLATNTLKGMGFFSESRQLSGPNGGPIQLETGAIEEFKASLLKEDSEE